MAFAGAAQSLICQDATFSVSPTNKRNRLVRLARGKRRDSTPTSPLKSGTAVCDSHFKHHQQLLLLLKTSISLHISLVERQQAQRDGQLLQAGNSFKSYRESSGNLRSLPLRVKNAACVCCQMLHCQLPLPEFEIGCCSGIARCPSL